MFRNCEGQSHKNSVHRPQLLKRKESRSGFEPRSLCLPALPLFQTGSLCYLLKIKGLKAQPVAGLDGSKEWWVAMCLSHGIGRVLRSHSACSKMAQRGHFRYDNVYLLKVVLLFKVILGRKGPLFRHIWSPMRGRRLVQPFVPLK